MLTLIAVFAVQLVAVAAAWLLRAREHLLRRQMPYLVALAVGVLLATALLHLLPESVEALGDRRGLWLTLGATLLALFTLERVFQSFTGVAAEPHQPDADTPAHVHGEACNHFHSQSVHSQSGSLRPMNLLVGSSLHSFVDGTAIATAFAVNARLGLLTAFAVALHEVPHRLGDVAVLLHLGVPAPKTMRFAVLAGAPSLVGAAAVLLLGEAGSGVFRWLLPISAGSFLYIAGANLLPELQTPMGLRQTCNQLLCLITGLAIVLAVTGLHAG
jgi:zinc and cadmium transporter